MTTGRPSEQSLADADRILARCDQLAGISDTAGVIRRVHLSPEHAQVNEIVGEWMRQAGLRTWQDAAGNLCARREGSEPGVPALLLGSHLDTVTDAGRYDGILGVMLAISVLERVGADVEAGPVALEIVAFSDEEGTRFGEALSGSRALAGAWHPEWWELRDDDGVSMRDAFINFGLDPEKVGEAARAADDLVGYLEAHIEQGPYLEDADHALGIVTSIAGARRFFLTVTGRAGHAGGTPYDRRRDALVGASELVVEIERIGTETGVIATVGRVQAFPGGVNVIPGRVELSLDLRAEHDADRDAVWQQIVAAAESIVVRRRLEFSASEIYRADAVTCAQWLQDAVAVGIAATDAREPISMWSRAGHDGMAVSDVTDIGMLFVRCAGGVSHHPDESVTREDVALALDAFEAAVRVALAAAAAGAAGATSGQDS